MVRRAKEREREREREGVREREETDGKAEIRVNRTNRRMIRFPQGFHSTSTRLCVITLPFPFANLPTSAIRIRDWRDDRDDEDGSGNPREADSEKAEDVSPSIKLPRTRERRPPLFPRLSRSFFPPFFFLHVFLSFPRFPPPAPARSRALSLSLTPSFATATAAAAAMSSKERYRFR